MEIKLTKESAAKMIKTCDALLASEPPVDSKGRRTGRMKRMSDKELRELDCYLAEHVMGWEWYCAVGNAFLIPPFARERFDAFSVHWTKGIYEKGWTRTEPDKEPCKKRFDIENVYCDYDYCIIPHYTTDPAAMVQVLEKCVERRSVVINKEPTGMVSVVELKMGALGLLHTAGVVTADTLPLAICLFAKKLFSE